MIDIIERTFGAEPGGCNGGVQNIIRAEPRRIRQIYADRRFSAQQCLYDRRSDHCGSGDRQVAEGKEKI